MSTHIFSNQQPYPPFIHWGRIYVLWATIVYAIWAELFSHHYISWTPDILLCHASHSYCSAWAPWTSSAIIPYQSLSIGMLFDLLLLNAFFTPIATFVHSFLRTKQTIILLIQLITISALTTYISQLWLFPQVAEPLSLFNAVAFGICVFWALVHSKGSPSLIIAIPVKPWFAIAITAAMILTTPALNHQWTQCLLPLITGLYTYLWAICRWKLRSHIEALAPLEEFLSSCYSFIAKIRTWKLFR